MYTQKMLDCKKKKLIAEIAVQADRNSSNRRTGNADHIRKRWQNGKGHDEHAYTAGRLCEEMHSDDSESIHALSCDIEMYLGPII